MLFARARKGIISSPKRIFWGKFLGVEVKQSSRITSTLMYVAYLRADRAYGLFKRVTSGGKVKKQRCFCEEGGTIVLAA